MTPHHRAYTNPREVLRFTLSEFDGVLAFGEAIRKIYSEAFGVKRVWTFHEAADTTHFFPTETAKDTDVVWIGNWGDEERARGTRKFLMQPSLSLTRCKFAVHGVRYPDDALGQLAASGVEFRGYLSNLHARGVYARSRISLHVPRRFYANGLSGVPTIRVFEALASGSPLVCSPWSDSEGLFRPDQDYICVPDTFGPIDQRAQIPAPRQLRPAANRRERTRNCTRATYLCPSRPAACRHLPRTGELNG